MNFIAILAMDQSLLIGKSGGLPWHISEDMERFKKLTMNQIVIMGRKTYFSLPEKVRPLPHRRNIVLTREMIEGVECFSDIDSLMITLESEGIDRAYVIGGAHVYDQFFARGLVDRVECTLVDGDHEGDIFVSEWRDDFSIISEQHFPGGMFITYQSKNNQTL